MNAKNLMLGAALAASVAGCLGSALSPASATTIPLSGLGSDFEGGSPTGDSASAAVTPTGGADVQAPDVTSEQFSMLNGGDGAQNDIVTGTMGDAATVTESFTAPGDSTGISTFDPRISLPDGIGSVTFGNLDFTAMTALATPKAAAVTVMLSGFASFGFAAYRRSRKASAPLAA